MKPLKPNRKRSLVLHYLKEEDVSQNAELKYSSTHYPSRKYNNQRFNILSFSKKL